MQDDLFASRAEQARAQFAPLPARLRPRKLVDVVGQPQLLAPGAAFRSMVERGAPVSMILWGPPGTGKTTLARLIAQESSAAFEQLSATSAGVRDVREVLGRARTRLVTDEQRTILFLDEIHRFSKNQQDALLPGVEDGTVILVGATTENPFFEVNSPLISRCALFRLEGLDSEAVGELINRAVSDEAIGLRDISQIDAEALLALSERTGGDARLALNVLEMAGTIALDRNSDVIEIGDVEQALQRRVVRYDKSGDRHYDVVSAFIKSMRGSDPDAALFWLFTMLEAGEDPEFIARRMIIFASEDIGLADQTALPIAVAASQALQFVGLPEAAFGLAQAVIYLAVAPKSNSVTAAMELSRQAVEGNPSAQVPLHLRDSHYSGAKELGHGASYRYPHGFPQAQVDQQYLPAGVELKAYRPGDQGFEKTIAERMASWERLRNRPSSGGSSRDRA